MSFQQVHLHMDVYILSPNSSDTLKRDTPQFCDGHQTVQYGQVTVVTIDHFLTRSMEGGVRVRTENQMVDVGILRLLQRRLLCVCGRARESPAQAWDTGSEVMAWAGSSG